MECQRGQNRQTTRSHCQMVTAFSNQHNPLSNVHSQNTNPFSKQKFILKAEIHSQLDGQSIPKTEIQSQMIDPSSEQKYVLKWTIHSQSRNAFSNGQSILEAEIHSQMDNPFSKQKYILKRTIPYQSRNTFSNGQSSLEAEIHSLMDNPLSKQKSTILKIDSQVTTMHSLIPRDVGVAEYMYVLIFVDRSIIIFCPYLGDSTVFMIIQMSGRHLYSDRL